MDTYIVYVSAIKKILKKIKIYHRKKQKIKFNSSHNRHIHSVRVCTSQNFKFFQNDFKNDILPKV